MTTMTLQTVDDLHADAHRLKPEVVEAMREWQEDHPEAPWHVEYEIPAETNGWVYAGDSGAASCTHNWFDQYPEWERAVVLHETPTHPQDETPDVFRVYHTRNLDDQAEQREARETVFEKEGEPYRTPIWVSRRIFWEAVGAAIEWMEDNPP